MSAIEVGQVIALIVRFNNQGSVATRPHPYLVVGVDHDLDVIELAQIDSLQGKRVQSVIPQ